MINRIMVLGFKPQFVEPILNGTKIHTIREDEHDRWNPGMKIHMATGVRTKHYKCFKQAECVSTQKITFVNREASCIVVIDDTYIFHWNKITEYLAPNDGFTNPFHFLDFFFPKKTLGDWTGKIIHWTDFQYDYKNIK